MNENKTTIFIDTQDMEERYGEELYKEYLEKENQQLTERYLLLEKKCIDLKEVIEKVREYIEETIRYKSTLNEDNWEFRVKTMLQILNKVKGEDNE